MERIGLRVVGFAVLASLLCGGEVGESSCSRGCVSLDEISSAIRDSVMAENAFASTPVDLRQLYERASYEPLWIVDSRASNQALQVLEYIAGIAARGLRPADYGIGELKALVATLDSAVPAARLAKVDMSMSAAVLRLLSDLHRGRVDPATLGIDLPPKDDLDLLPVVVEVSRAERVGPVIESVEPRYPEYASLIGALAHYRALAADTSLHPPRDPRVVVKSGDQYAGVRDLSRLLHATGDLADTAWVDPWHFDGAIVEAVRAFQRRHGLEPDGALGRATLRELNAPLPERVRQIELALERWRWLPHAPPDRYVMVNVPEFRLRAYDRHVDSTSAALTLNLVVGRAGDRHQTPVFAAEMREVVLNPYWDVPLPIARDELVPSFRRKPRYFAAAGFEIVEGPGENARVVSPSDGNLSRVAAGSLRLRQRPGRSNALGMVKLVFPNRYNVFLHDTPERHLFARAQRDFSHGCIRVERPMTLAEFVLLGEPGWNEAAIQGALRESRTKHISLTRPLTVFIQYFTASVDESGAVLFAFDLYRRDVKLAAALTQRAN